MNEFLADQLRSKVTNEEEKKFVEHMIKELYDIDEKLKNINGHTDPMNSYETMIAKFDLYPEAVDKLITEIYERMDTKQEAQDEVKRIMATLLHFIGLAGEVGELGEKIKKSIRDGYRLDLRDNAIAKEMGDVEWYLTRLESDFGYPKNEILRINYDKLSARLTKDKLHGSGDDREQ